MSQLIITVASGLFILFHGQGAGMADGIIYPSALPDSAKPRVAQDREAAIHAALREAAIEVALDKGGQARLYTAKPCQTIWEKRERPRRFKKADDAEKP